MRKETRITLTEDGRTLDFVIRQLPATALMDWILRAVQCVGDALEMPDGAGIEAAGKALETKGLSALTAIDYDRAKPLLDTMLGTASRIVDGAEHPCSTGTVDGYISDVKTLFKLYVECFKCNLGFFKDAAPSRRGGEVPKQGIRISRT